MFQGRNLQEDKNYRVISSLSHEPVPVNVFSAAVSDLLQYPSDVPRQKSTRRQELLCSALSICKTSIRTKPYDKHYSRTPDQDFCCFCPCEIILSHIPITACGIDKNRTAACQPHAGCRSICEVIVMFKLRDNVASQRIQDFLEAFFIFFQYKKW